MCCKKVVPVTQPTAPAPAVVVPTSPVIPNAPAKLVTQTTPVATPQAKPAPPTNTQQFKALCAKGVDQVETNRMIAKGIKNPDGSQIIVCNI